MVTPDHSGVVLAGGTSRRFERGNKVLATIDGVSLVERVVERLGAAVENPVVVSVRTADQADEVERALEDSDCLSTVVRDVDGFEGPLAGVRAALDHVDTDELAFVAADMPLFDPDIVDWLSLHRRGVDAVIPVADRPQPLQALYGTDALERALSRVPQSAGLFALLEELDSVNYVSDGPPSLSVERSLTNVNTVEDLRRVRTPSPDDPRDGS